MTKAESDLETGWLAYARSVVSAKEHIASCAAKGGSPDHPGVDAVDLRWPGYLGAEYRRGGVLCVANVHRDFASGGFGATAAVKLVDGTRKWSDGAMTDSVYLGANRGAYSVGLRKWTVGSRVGAVLAALRTPVEAIAYTNAARCQYPEVPPVLPRAGETKKKLVKLCVARFPIGDLVRTLEPAVVLFTSVVAYDESQHSIDSRVVIVAFHQWYGNLTRPLDLGKRVLEPRTPLPVWTAALSETLRDRGFGEVCS